MSEADAAEQKDCRGCGEPTTARVEGVPYCSMSCIGARRRELNTRTYHCPQPECDWSHQYNTESKLAVCKFNVELDHHARQEHGVEVLET